MLTANESFCTYCGNPKRNKQTNKCTDTCCDWYSNWEVDSSNPKSVENVDYIKAEIADMNW